jgi:hypothetical protein
VSKTAGWQGEIYTVRGKEGHKKGVEKVSTGDMHAHKQTHNTQRRLFLGFGGIGGRDAKTWICTHNTTHRLKLKCDYFLVLGYRGKGCEDMDMYTQTNTHKHTDSFYGFWGIGRRGKLATRKSRTPGADTLTTTTQGGEDHGGGRSARLTSGQSAGREAGGAAGGAGTGALTARQRRQVHHPREPGWTSCLH